MPKSSSRAISIKPLSVENNRFIQELFGATDITEEVAKFDQSECSHCPNKILNDWPYPTKSFILSLTGIRETKINVKICSHCKRGFYPNLFSKGLIPIHNKFLLRKVL